MNEIITERTEGILKVQLNRPAKKNALTSAMYIGLADLLNGAAKDEQIRVVLLHGAGDSFSAGNDLEDFMNNPPGAGESPQSRLIQALIDFDKPLVAAVHGAAAGSGTTILPHFDFVYAGESAKFMTPFVNLGLVPEFGSSYLLPACIGHLWASEMLLLGMPVEARRAAEFGLVTRVVPDQDLLATAIGVAQKLAGKGVEALRASKRLMKHASRDALEQAVKLENEEFSVRVRSPEARKAIAAFFEKRAPSSTGAKKSQAEATAAEPA